MLLLATFAALFLAAIGGWVVTHMDLIRCPWFRRSLPLRLVLSVGLPAAGAFGVDVLFVARYGEVAPWAAVVACAMAAVGLALAISRPFKPARPEYVREEADCRR